MRKLKLHFNVSFDELYDLKEDCMNKINDWRDNLRNVLNELVTTNPKQSNMEKLVHFDSFV